MQYFKFCNLKITFLLLVLVFFILNSSYVIASTITVTASNGAISSDGNCSITEAIHAANSNTTINECSAGDDSGGSDSISLQSDIVLSAEFENDSSFGRTGTPAISSAIVIEGNGHTIQRDNSLACTLNSTEDAGEFRLMRITNPGDLDLRNIILKNGCADGLTTDSKIGGAILNFSATLTLSNSIIENNKAEFRGGGVDTTFGTSTISNTFLTDNESNFGGAAFSNFTSSSNITNSTLANNTAGNRGGAIWNIDGTGGAQNSTLTLINNTFSANTSNVDAGAIYNDNAQITGSLNNTITGSRATNSAGAIYNSATGTIDMTSFLFNDNGGGMDECFNDGGTFTSNIGMTDHAGGCSPTVSALINLLPLADNGCLTPLADGTCIKTHGLSFGSQAINPAQALIGVDQRGFNQVDIRRDIGSFEFLSANDQCIQLGLVSSTTGNTFTAVVSDSFELNQAITCANLELSTTDTINISNDISLTHQIVKTDGSGATGTPLIQSPMILDGNEFTLQRDLSFSCDVNDIETNTEFRILHVATNGDLDLQDITLKNGCVDSDSSVSRGAGVLNKGNLSITNSTITENQADFGAGISNRGPSGAVISLLDRVIISNNTAGFSGGGIENTLATITEIRNSIIRDNTVTSVTNAKGGGIFNDASSTLTTIFNSSIENNTSAFDGGGLYSDSTIASIKSSTFSGNQADSDGGGIRALSVTEIHNSTFSNNRANKGGAIFTSGNLQDVMHSTFSDNQADVQGGALFSSGGTSQVNNSLFRKNLGTNRDCATAGSGDINGDNNISDTSGGSNVCDAIIASGLDNSTVGDLTDNGCNNEVLANGSCVKTHALLDSSLAIDFINPSTFAEDQRGFMVIDNLRDAGAFEYISPSELCAQNSIDINAPFVSFPSTAVDFIQALVCANANDATLDAINLSADISFSQAYEDIDTGNFNDIASKGRTATPAISSPIIIDGMGFMLGRDTNLTCDDLSSSDPEDFNRFRLLRVASTGTLDISNIILANGCVLKDSEKHQYYGGAIYNSGVLTVTNSFITENRAAYGGVIYNYEGTIISVENNIFTQNVIADAGFFGSGLANDNGQINRIVNNAFTDNKIFHFGGGIANINNGVISLIDKNTFNDNQAQFAGSGIYNSNGAIITNIENSTFSGNEGTGITNLSQIDNISNSTFFANTAFGIHNDNATINSINNSILDECFDLNGVVFNGSNNFSYKQFPNCPGTSSFNLTEISPILMANDCTTPLADGTCVKTHAINLNSTLIDTGDVIASNMDQRGFHAINGRDIGAFEFSTQLNPSEFCEQYGLDSLQFNVSVSTEDELNTSIFCANLNDVSTDTINLTADINLTHSVFFIDFLGGSGTFAINTPMIIDGQGFSLQRDSSFSCINGQPNDSEFRLLIVDHLGDLTLNNITLKNGCLLNPNHGRNGAGIFSIGQMAIQNTIFENNKGGFEGSTGANGGAIHNQGGISIIENSLFVSNNAFIGGGLSNEGGTIDLVKNVMFTENTAGLSGGGLFNRGTLVAIENSTFNSNDAVFGGSINNQALITSIGNSTFSGNTASNGGGIYNDGDISTINNNTYSGNSNGDLNNTGTGNIFLLQNSLINSCGNGSGTFNGSNNLSTNPTHNCPSATVTANLNLGPIQDNGCVTTLADGSCVTTHALLASSPALNVAVSGTSSDQRGFSHDGNRDMGAFEAFIPQVTAPDNISLEATGAMTAVTLGSATVTDIDESGLIATANTIGPFSVGVHTITWLATDSYGHIGSATQTVTITDSTAPIISLIGADPLILLVGGTFIDPGAEVVDLVDGTIQIIGTGSVNTNQAGSYEVHYNQTDVAGNSAIEVIRTVIVGSNDVIFKNSFED